MTIFTLKLGHITYYFDLGYQNLRVLNSSHQLKIIAL